MNVPCRFSAFSGLVPARSVPCLRSTWYCAGDSFARHSSSVCVTGNVSVSVACDEPNSRMGLPPRFMVLHSIGCRRWNWEDGGMTAVGEALQPVLPDDAALAALAGRVWRPDVGGPSVVAVRGGDLVDISASCPTMRDLCEADAPAERLRAAPGERIG